MKGVFLMPTTKVTLTTAPKQVTDGSTGVRIQSTRYKFRWVASTAAPTDLSFYVVDQDVYIEGKGPIWAWAESQYVGDVTVT